VVNGWQIHNRSHWLITAISIPSSDVVRECKQSFIETFSILYGRCIE
jgi:hypothetical protein